MRPLPLPQANPGMVPPREIFRRNHGQAGTRTLLLAALCLVIGLGLGALWHSRRGQRSVENPQAPTPGQDVGTLSAATMALLQDLPGPVEIRFYALLDTATAPEAVKDFAGRVEEVLAAYRREAHGKITVTRHRSPAEVGAAAADGIKPFNMDKGDPCYLGVAVIHSIRKETIPRLYPEWEQALESDLSRAISRVLSPAATAPATGVAPVDPATLAEVKRQIPNFGSISMPEGTRILREAAIKDFKAAMSEMQSRLEEAQQRIARAQDANTGEQQAALRELQRLQAEQAAKLAEISARSSAQIEALRQLKESPP